MDRRVVITQQQIFEKLVAVEEKLVRMEAAVDRVGASADAVMAHQADHEQRLRVLEKARWPLPSAALLAAVGSLVLAVVGFMGH